jgi:hypothetical protein
MSLSINIVRFLLNITSLSARTTSLSTQTPARPFADCQASKRRLVPVGNTEAPGTSRKIGQSLRVGNKPFIRV